MKRVAETSSIHGGFERTSIPLPPSVPVLSSTALETAAVEPFLHRKNFQGKRRVKMDGSKNNGFRECEARKEKAIEIEQLIEFEAGKGMKTTQGKVGAQESRKLDLFNIRIHVTFDKKKEVVGATGNDPGHDISRTCFLLQDTEVLERYGLFRSSTLTDVGEARDLMRTQLVLISDKNAVSHKDGLAIWQRVLYHNERFHCKLTDDPFGLNAPRVKPTHTPKIGLSLAEIAVLKEKIKRFRIPLTSAKQLEHFHSPILMSSKRLKPPRPTAGLPRPEFLFMPSNFERSFMKEKMSSTIIERKSPAEILPLFASPLEQNKLTNAKQSEEVVLFELYRSKGMKSTLASCKKGSTIIQRKSLAEKVPPFVSPPKQSKILNTKQSEELVLFELYRSNGVQSNLTSCKKGSTVIQRKSLAEIVTPSESPPQQRKLTNANECQELVPFDPYQSCRSFNYSPEYLECPPTPGRSLFPTSEFFNHSTSYQNPYEVYTSPANPEECYSPTRPDFNYPRK